tara:strand:- start:3061 stop:4977 length:1917 start_codon:yes stop_codon:yes gene_type:complete
MTERRRGIHPIAQGLLGLSAGILSSNKPTRYPGGGTEALGVGIQQGLQAYNQALTLEDKLDALREERALKGQLEDNLPAMIEQAIEMGVDKNITDNATLMSSIKPSAVYNMLSNAMVKAQKKPESEDQVQYLDPTMEELAVTPGLHKIEVKKDGSRQFLDRNYQPLQSFVPPKAEPLPASSPFSTEFAGFQDTATPVTDPRNPENILGYNIVTEPGKVEFRSVEQLRDKTPQQEPQVTGPFPELGQTIEIPDSTEILVHMGGGNYQRSPKEKIKETKEKAGFKYIGRNQEGFPTNAPADADEVELSPTGQRTFFKGGFPLQAPETKPEVQKFEYLDKASSKSRFSALYAQMGENDVIEVNPETGKAQIIFAPGADSEDLDYREIVSADGKTIQQGYYSKSTGKLVTDLGKTPRNLDKGLEIKDKLKFLIDRHKKPSDRLQAMVSNYESISKAVGAGKPFDDLALIFYIAKMLDPTSVVREGEQMIIRNTGALPDKFESYFLRLKDGKAFTKDQRRNILEFAKRKMDAELKTYNEVVDGIKRDAKPQRFNLNYDNEVVPALGIIHDKMDTSETFDRVMNSINSLDDTLDGDEKLNVTDTDGKIKGLVFRLVNEAIDARSSDKTKKKTVLSNEEGDSILE